MDTMKPALESLDAIIQNVENALNPPKTAEDSTKQTKSTTPPAASTSADPAPAPKQGKKKKEKKPKQPPPPQVDPVVAQFLQCDLRVGQVQQVSTHPEADGLYVLQVSYGADEVKTVCAGLRKFVPEEEMRDRRVVTICNLKPRKLRGVASEAMILAGSVVSGEGEKETVVPIGPPPGAGPGAIVAIEGMKGARTVVEGKFVSGKVWDKVVARLGVKGNAACYEGSPLTCIPGHRGTKSEDGSDPVTEVYGVVSCALPDGAEIH